MKTDLEKQLDKQYSELLHKKYQYQYKIDFWMTVFIIYFSVSTISFPILLIFALLNNDISIYLYVIMGLLGGILVILFCILAVLTVLHGKVPVDEFASGNETGILPPKKWWEF